MPRDNLTVNDLSDGDLVIWRMTEANHVEIYVKSKKLFEQTSIHAVNTPAKKMTRVMATSFRPACYKHVFHCKTKQLRLCASLYAERWAAYENRYDTGRINVKTAFREMQKNLGTSPEGSLKLTRELFYQRGRFRAIKYAARRRGILCYPGDQEGNGGRGMTCCMFAILCYQTAGLADHVKPLDGSPFFHISDKKISAKDAPVVVKVLDDAGFGKQDIGDYMFYVGCIQQQNEYRIDWQKDWKTEVVKEKPQPQRVGYLYVPSLMQWKTPASFGGFDWGAALTQGMLLDAKIANPEHIWQSLQADPRTGSISEAWRSPTHPRPPKRPSRPTRRSSTTASRPRPNAARPSPPNKPRGLFGCPVFVPRRSSNWTSARPSVPLGSRT
jgi:hypothetical protein